MHQYYHTPNKTDLQALKDSAQRKANKGEDAILHLHPYSEACPKTYCIVFSSATKTATQMNPVEDTSEG